MNKVMRATAEGGSGMEGVVKNTLSARLSVQRSAVFALLKQLADDCEQYFSRNANSSLYSKRLEESCREISIATPVIQELVRVLQNMAPRYDYDHETPGNGFRSLVCVCDMTVLHLISVLRACVEHRQTIMFRTSYYCKEVEGYGAVLRFFVLSFRKVIEISNQIPGDSLFPSLSDDYTKYHESLKEIEALDSSCFYGRPLGFQFVPSVGRIFRFIGIILATYSLSWEKGHGPIGSLINSGRFILSPEQRASRIIKVTREADIEFCRGFWNLAELGNHVPKFFCPNMAVNEVREINWVGPITMATTNGCTVRIPEPSSHTGVRPVRIRVLSYAHREILSPVGAQSQLPASPYLLFHCHGGGYVATSSKSHESYLRTWAKLLNCTVVSVDYSLAPENPFPRPTEEVLYAYAYIINNAAQMGWTGEKICMVGDSAGGNLIMSVNLRLVELKVRRKPDGIVSVYTPFLFQYLPSPSRLLSFMDPLLHMGIVLRCVAAYTSGVDLGKLEDESNTQLNSEKNGHKSLQEYVEQVQKAQKNEAVDFEGPSSIVSLVNLVPDSPVSDQMPPRSPPAKAAKADNDTILKSPQSDDEDEVNEGNVALSGVQVNSDPLRIHLSSSIYDRQLVDYLSIHPLTKNSLILLDRNGCCQAMPLTEPLTEENRQAELSDSATERPDRPRKLSSSVYASSGTSPISTPVTSENTSAWTAEQYDVTMPSNNSQNIVSASESLAHKRSLSQSIANTAALAAGHAFDNLSDWLEKTSPVGQTDKAKLDRAASLTPQMAAKMQQAEAAEAEVSSRIDKLIRRRVPRDALISPLYATADQLRQLPPMWFVACHLDPLLDDTVSFARKARDCGGKVMAVDLLDNLPHGFLNFTLMSPECREGAKICLMRIKEALGMTERLS